MFHFTRFASTPYIPPVGGPSDADGAACATPGCPIRKSRDLSLFGGSPGLIAAHHVLHRLLAPRHPPCTLGSLTLGSPSLGARQRHSPPAPLLFTCQRTIRLHYRAALPGGATRCKPRFGGDDRGRTGNLGLAKPALSQLSYIPPGISITAQRTVSPALVGLSGLEPLTSPLSGARSSRLSYRPGSYREGDGSASRRARGGAAFGGALRTRPVEPTGSCLSLVASPGTRVNVGGSLLVRASAGLLKSLERR
jgi:hypothetical protein